MAKPTLRTPKFGAWLTTRRGRRADSMIATQLREALGRVLSVDRSSVRKLEKGQLPNVLMLYAISRVFKTSIEDVVRAVVNELAPSVTTTPTLPTDPMPSDEALALARWFDNQPAERRRSVFVTLGIDRNTADGVAHASSKKAKRGLR